MKSVYFWIVLLTIVGIVASLYLVPSKEELALIRLKSEQLKSAEAFYKKQYDSGVRTPDTVFELSLIYEKAGRLKEAIQVIKEYTKTHLKDASAYNRLAQLYYENKQFEEYDQTLLKMQEDKLPLESDTLMELAEYFKNKNETQKQIDAIKKLIDMRKAGESDYDELAAIYASEKKYQDAAEILKKRRLLFPKKNTIDSLLFEVWVDVQANTVKESNILQVLADFLIKFNKPKTTSLALGTFKEKYPDLLPQFVTLLEPAIQKDPYLESVVLQLLWDYPGEEKQTHQLFEKLVKYAKNFPELQNFMFNIYLDRYDDANLLHLIQNTPPERFNERSIVNVAVMAIIRNHPELAIQMQKALGHDYLEKHPIRQLALSMGAQDKDARSQLDKFLASKQITPTERYYLFSLAGVAKYYEEAFELGSKFPPFDGMQEDELIEIAQVYAQMKKADWLYTQIQSSMLTVGVARAAAALALLNIARHYTKKSAEWLRDQKKIKENTLKAFYIVAEDNKEYPLALYAAKRLYKDYPTFYSEASYGTALVQVGIIEPGLAHLRKVYNENPSDVQVQNNYLTALVEATKRNDRFKDELLAYMNTLEQKGNISSDIQRQFAYAYLEILHDSSKAKKMFEALANKPKPDQTDIESLIYLWGPNVTEAQAQWIVEKAKKSNLANVSYWLDALNFIGRYSVTIELFEMWANEILTSKAFYAYLQALAFEKRTDKMQQVMDRIFYLPWTRKELEELSIYAEEAEYGEMRTRIWERIVADQPEDPLAWQGLARAAFDENFFTRAREALEIFFELESMPNPKMYESLYEYAEILRREHYFFPPLWPYILALDEIAAAEEITVRMKEIAAHSYYQLSMRDEALCMMIEFYIMSGRDSNAAASYANMLMDYGRMASAGLFLHSVFRPQRGLCVLN